MTISEKKKAVFRKKKGLKSLYTREGNTSIEDFYKKNTRGLASSSLKNEFLAEFKKILYKRIQDKKVTNAVLETLSNEWSVGTAEHHGILTHPFFFSNALLSAYRDKKNIAIFFSFANISLDNSSYPRGIFFHDDEGNKKKYIFFPHSKRHLSAYTAQTKDYGLSYNKTELKNLFPFIEKAFKENTLYRDTVTQATYTLGTLIDPEIKIIYIDIESIVSALLVKIHLNKKTDIHALLFDQKFHEIFLRRFDGIAGAFATKNKSGTFLFWYIKNGSREQLFYEDGYLVAKSGYRIHLDKKNLKQALLKEELLPSMGLCFIVVSLYYKIVCGGGFSQIDYLEDIQNAWVISLKEYIGVNMYKKVYTKKFQGEFGVITLKTSKRTVLATPFDWLLYGDKKTIVKFKESVAHITVKEALNAMMDEYYKITEGHYDTEQYEPNISPILKTKKL